MRRLPLSFFNRPTITVAQELLGKEIFFKGQKAVITETEAYIGENDPACHAARGKTKRTAVMYGRAGFSYVYLIYGMYYCLNFVTEEEGFPAAVLIRAVRISGIPDKKLNGPGKLCRFWALQRNITALICCNPANFMFQTPAFPCLLPQRRASAFRPDRIKSGVFWLSRPKNKGWEHFPAAAIRIRKIAPLRCRDPYKKRFVIFNARRPDIIFGIPQIHDVFPRDVYRRFNSRRTDKRHRPDIFVQ